MTAYDRVIDAFRGHGLVVDERSGRAYCQAPGHSLADRSVTFTPAPDKVLMSSFADDRAEVLAAVGLTWSDLFDNPCGRSQPLQSTLTAGQKLLRDRRNEQRRQRRAEMDNAHASERARELAEAARIAAEQTSDRYVAVRSYVQRMVGERGGPAPVAGSPEWIRLDDEDMSKMVAVLTAGTLWVLVRQLEAIGDGDRESVRLLPSSIVGQVIS